MENTVMSFWQMVWEQEVHLITTLTPIDPNTDCLPFWPTSPLVAPSVGELPLPPAPQVWSTLLKPILFKLHFLEHAYLSSFVSF